MSNTQQLLKLKGNYNGITYTIDDKDYKTHVFIGNIHPFALEYFCKH